MSWPLRLDEMVKGKKYGGKEIEIGNFGRGGASISEGFEDNKDF